MAVVIDVRRGDSTRIRANRKHGGTTESTDSVAEEHTHVTGAAARSRQVQVAVLVEIARYQTAGSRAGGKDRRRGETAQAVAGKDSKLASIRRGDRQVDMTVLIEILDDNVGGVTRTQTNLICPAKRAVAAAEVDRHRVAVRRGDGQIGVVVFVEVAGRHDVQTAHRAEDRGRSEIPISVAQADAHLVAKGQAIAAAVGQHDIQMAVVVDVGRGDSGAGPSSAPRIDRRAWPKAAAAGIQEDREHPRIIGIRPDIVCRCHVRQSVFVEITNRDLAGTLWRRW